MNLAIDLSTAPLAHLPPAAALSPDEERLFGLGFERSRPGSNLWQHPLGARVRLTDGAYPEYLDGSTTFAPGGWSAWGEIELSRLSAPGVNWISTAGHGGFHVSPDVRELWHPTLQDANTHNSWVFWFEEDCDWAIVAAAWPEAFTAETVARAMQSLSRWHPVTHAALLANPRPTDARLIRALQTGRIETH